MAVGIYCLYGVTPVLLTSLWDSLGFSGFLQSFWCTGEVRSVCVCVRPVIPERMSFNNMRLIFLSAFFFL